MNPTPAQEAHMERTGRWWETVGGRTAGRILGWLMVCDPPHQSSADLMAAVHTSAGSVSTQCRNLERMGLVERQTFRGDRATYYQLRPNVWVEILRTKQAELETMKVLADAAYEIVPEQRPDRVHDLGRVAEFFLAEWPALLMRFEQLTEKASAQ